MPTGPGSNAFRFPYNKYNDPYALNANFRYLQDYMLRGSINDAFTATHMVSAPDSSNPQRAEYQAPAEEAHSTIQAAMDDLPVAGGTLHFLEGTYIIDGTITWPNKPVVWECSGNATLQIGANTVFNFTNAVQYHKFDGFKWTGGAAGLNLLNPRGPFVFVNNTITDFTVRTFMTVGALLFFSEMLIHHNHWENISIETTSSDFNALALISHGSGGSRAGHSVVSNNYFNNITHTTHTGASYHVVAGGASDRPLVVTDNIVENSTTLTSVFPSTDFVVHNTIDGVHFPGSHNLSINDLNDVTISGTPADNEVLAYDTALGEWINQTAAEASLSEVGHGHTESDISDLDHPHELADLSDVGVTTPTNRNALMGDGVSWESRAVVEADVSDLAHTTDAADLTSGVLADARVQGSNVTQHQAALSITESQISDLDHDDTDAIHDNVASEISIITAKASPVSGDFLLIEDSEATNVKKRITIGDLPGSAATLGALTDVADATATGQNVLVADGIDWHSRALVEADISDLGDYVQVAGDTMTGELLLPDGSAALPSLSFSNDPNTGMYVSAPDQLAFSAGGSAQLKIGPTVAIGPAFNSNIELLVKGDAARTARFYMETITASDRAVDLYSDVGTVATSKAYLEADGDWFNNNGTYGTVSDRRLKVESSIKTARSYLDDLNKLQVRKYRLKGGDHDLLGFIADEVKEVFPGLVSVSTDEEHEQVKTSVLIPMLVTAIQDQQKQIDDLSAKVKKQQGTIDDLGKRLGKLEAKLAKL